MRSATLRPLQHSPRPAPGRPWSGPYPRGWSVGRPSRSVRLVGALPARPSRRRLSSLSPKLALSWRARVHGVHGLDTLRPLDSQRSQRPQGPRPSFKLRRGSSLVSIDRSSEALLLRTSHSGSPMTATTILRSFRCGGQSPLSLSHVTLTPAGGCRYGVTTVWMRRLC